jgi:hypothetical protein
MFSLCMVLPVRTSDIAESMLKICYPLEKVDVNFLPSDNIRWPCDNHNTISIDNNSTRHIPLIDLQIVTQQFSNRLAITMT